MTPTVIDVLPVVGSGVKRHNPCPSVRSNSEEKLGDNFEKRFKLMKYLCISICKKHNCDRTIV